MKTINLIYGSSGFAKEVDWLISDIYSLNSKIDFRPDFFVIGNSVNENFDEINGKKIITEMEVISNLKSIWKDNLINVFLAVGNPYLKEKIKKNIPEMNNISFPVLIHPSVQFDSRETKVNFAQGVIVCAGVSLTTDIIIKDFVHINLNSTIGHDTIIEDFSTLSPGVNISGNVLINQSVFIGTNATILERLEISSNVILGANSLVTKSIKHSGTYVGQPVKRIK